jgi:hypothetical protein
MKKLHVTKFAVTAFIAAQLLSSVSHAANINQGINGGHNFNQIIKTNSVQGLEDPYYQIKSTKITEISDEEALEFVNQENITQKNNKFKLMNDIGDKGFVGPNVPNIPNTPPANGGNGPVVSLPSDNTANLPTTTPSGGVGALDSVIMVVDKLIAIGQKIIPMIKDGKSVITNSPMTAVSVLPRTDLKDFQVHDMGGWSIPINKHYKISFNNGFGVEVVSFVYSITYQYNGSMDGKGKYLAGIRAAARNIDIMWGFDLDASSQLIQIANVGTQQNVVAGATIEMTYTVKNWTRNLTYSQYFHISGDGKLYKLD